MRKHSLAVFLVYVWTAYWLLLLSFRLLRLFLFCNNIAAFSIHAGIQYMLCIVLAFNLSASYSNIRLLHRQFMRIYWSLVATVIKYFKWEDVWKEPCTHSLHQASNTLYDKWFCRNVMLPPVQWFCYVNMCFLKYDEEWQLKTSFKSKWQP